MYLAGLIVILVLLAGALTGLDYLWGINIWSYFGIPLIIAFAGGSLLLINRKTFESVEKFTEKIKFTRVHLFVSLIIFLVIFILFNQSVFFLGDGYLRIRNAEALQYYSSGSPLANYFTILIYDKIALPNGFSALSVWRFISYLSGIISLIIFDILGKKLFDSEKKFIFAAILIFSSSLSQLYFGYVESYTLYYPLLLGYYLSTLSMLKTGKYSLNPAIWIIFAFFVSPTAVIFSPAVLYSYYSITLKKNSSSKEILNFVKPIFTVIIITLLTALFLYLVGFTADNYYKGLTKVNHILSIFPTETDQGILDLTHFNDIINQILLVAPGIVLLLFVSYKNIIKSDNSKVIFLLINFLCAILFMLIFRADISFVRDWDLFAFITYPVLFLILVIFYSESKVNYYPVYIAVILSLSQSLPWILLNSNEKMSLKRMTSISNISYLPDYAKSNNYDVLRQYYREGIEINNPSAFVMTEEKREKIEKSLYYTTLAYNYEKNERFLYNIALYAFVLKERDTAKKYLNLLIDSKYESKHLAHALLSKVYIDESNLPSAIDELKKVENIFPDSETVKLDIANLYYNAGEPRNSYNYFQKAFSINPDNPETLDYLIELSYIADTRKKTVEYYHKYDKVNQGNPHTYYNLALCFNELRNIDSARHYAKLAEKKGISKELLDKISNLLK